MSEKKNGEQQVFWRKNNPIAYGVAISIIVLIGYSVVGFRTECIGSFCENNFQKFWDADPNEVGDTLAGLFGALAFVWIIVTVFLQSQELREQREELREQRLATQEMSKAMNIQVDILLDEKTQRVQKSTDEEVNSLIEELQILLREDDLHELVWTGGLVDEKLTMYGNKSFKLDFTYPEIDLTDDKIRHQTDKFATSKEKVEKAFLEDEILEKPKRPNILFVIIDLIEKIEKSSESCSPAMQSRLRSLRLTKLKELTKEIATSDILWDLSR